MQISRQQERRWAEDPEDFIQDEEEHSIGPRASGALSSCQRNCFCNRLLLRLCCGVCLLMSECFSEQAAFSWSPCLCLLESH